MGEKWEIYVGQLTNLSKKRIIFFLPRYHTNLVGIISYFTLKKIKTRLLVFKKGKTENYLIKEPEIIPKKKINNFFLKLNIVNYFKLRKLIKFEKNSIAIIRLDNISLDLFIPLFLKIFTNINFYFYSQTSFDYYNSLSFIKKIKYFIFLTFLKTKIITPIFNLRNFKINKFFIPLPFIVKMNKQKIIKTNYLKILTVGKFQLRKNFLLLIKALQKLKINYRLIIIGEISNEEHKKEYKRINDYIIDNKLSKNIKIIINLPNIKIKKYYNWCDFFILASTREPASISPIESISFRKPVICSSNNGIRPYIFEGYNGYIFKDNNINSLKNRIYKMSKNYKSHQKNLLLINEKYLNETLMVKIINKYFINKND